MACNTEITVTDEQQSITVNISAVELVTQGSVGSVSYTHQQTIAATEWIVNHNLGFRPNFEVTTDGGVQKWADGIHTSPNQLRVYWSEPSTGFVRCN